MSLFKPNTRYLKKFFLIVLIVVFAAGSYLAFKSYEAAAPKRAVANFMNALTKDGDITQAYHLTTSSYQHKVSFDQFAQDFKPLFKSKVPYTILGSRLVRGVAITGGVLEDLNGKNYNYLVGVAHSSGQWLVQSVVIAKQ